MPATLFVYGTLKRGGSNHHRLGGCRFLGEARTRPVYRLFVIDWYPGLVPAEAGVAVEGELWEVDEPTLRRLDDYEGVPHWFDRGPVELHGPARPVQAYFYRGDTTGKRESGTCWPCDALRRAGNPPGRSPLA